MCFVVFACSFLFSCQNIGMYIHLMNFSSFKTNFKLFPKVPSGSRFGQKAVSFRLTIEKRRSSFAFQSGRDKINFTIGRRRLNRFVPFADVISPIRFHTISIRSARWWYFPFNGDLGISLSSKSWNLWNFCCSSSISTWEDCNVRNQWIINARSKVMVMIIAW